MALTSMIFGNTEIHGPGDDSWFWPPIGPEPWETKHFLELVDEWRAPGPDGARERRYAAVYAPAGEADKAYNPDQPRHPAGTSEGGQWRPAEGARPLPPAWSPISTGDINAMRAEMDLPPLEPEPATRKPSSTSRKIRELGGGINRTVLLEDDAGTRWVWKSVKGESGQDGNSEVAAYEIAQVLGMDCVPLTRYEEFDGVLGTAQQFVDGTIGAEWTARYGTQTALDILPRSTEDVVVLDAIINNTDRHTGNWIVAPNNAKIWAIDNGGSYWEKSTGNEFVWVYSNTLVNDFYDRKRGEIRIAPEKLARWSRITKEEFLGAFRDMKEGTIVNPDNAWENLQAIIAENGTLIWRHYSDYTTVKKALAKRSRRGSGP